jgi:DNA-binding phage protein
MQHRVYATSLFPLIRRHLVPKKMTPHEMALAALVPDDERTEFERGVEVLVARNRALEVLERERRAQKVSKKDLALRAGLDYASVRRLLTADTANPTTETMLRLFSALHIHVQAKLPSGRVVALS